MRQQIFAGIREQLAGRALGARVPGRSGLGTRKLRSKAERLSEQAERKELSVRTSSKLGGGHFSPTDAQRSTLMGG